MYVVCVCAGENCMYCWCSHLLLRLCVCAGTDEGRIYKCSKAFSGHFLEVLQVCVHAYVCMYVHMYVYGHKKSSHTLPSLPLPRATIFLCTLSSGVHSTPMCLPAVEPTGLLKPGITIYMYSKCTYVYMCS